MRELGVLAFVTVDGVMQSPSAPGEDPSGGFTEGGWAAPYWDGVMPHVERTAMASPYDILFGRKTYDIFAGHWPNAPKSDVADLLNSARKYVATARGDALTWENSRALADDVVSAVQRLKSEDGPRLQIHGSAALIQTLLATDLIDVFQIWTFPVVVGAGKRLFEAGVTPRRYALQSVEALEIGVVHQVLRRAEGNAP
ncbi:dihydrofolate reductase family protein [uncultured Tateyamaria sp.]|uniref:dihydrofolate reductase family protein n=1 Tax=uncultured Tateyamaria sp. TaxID=455651 RepID=UPI002619FD9C|nr:dihydrofolate reductase family protein [uncultured Tateyamaria sp.]